MMMTTTMTMLVLLLLLLLGMMPEGANAFMAPTTTGTIIGNNPVRAATLTTLTMTGTEGASPSTFREAEVLGLKLMQERKYEEALKGTSLALCVCVWIRIAHEMCDVFVTMPASFCSLSNGFEVTGK
jgi:hypothetical protein